MVSVKCACLLKVKTDIHISIRDVLLSNLDGHYSELRCSLPIHLLAKELLDETLVATNANRTALLGENHGVLVQEIVLPAYQDHLRDRGMFLVIYGF
jgi:hypothetical protein